jgi:hypothetical protein
VRLRPREASNQRDTDLQVGHQKLECVSKEQHAPTASCLLSMLAYLAPARSASLRIGFDFAASEDRGSTGRVVQVVSFAKDLLL